MVSACTEWEFKMRNLVNVWIASAIVVGGAQYATAGSVEIVDATAKKSSNGTYSFSVTLKHGDTGWEHYANAWDVTAPDGTVLGTRKLLHPHVDEQPFTRSLSGIEIGSDISEVVIRAYDKVHGLSEKTFKLTLPGRE